MLVTIPSGKGDALNLWACCIISFFTCYKIFKWFTY